MTAHIWKMTPKQRAELTPAACITLMKQDRRIAYTLSIVQYLTSEQRTPAVCLAAVQTDGHTVAYLMPDERSDAICLAAVQQNVWAIQWLAPYERTPAICLIAIQYVANMLLDQLSADDFIKCIRWTPELHPYYSDSTRQRIETIMHMSTPLPLEIVMGLACRTPYVPRLYTGDDGVVLPVSQ